MIRSFSSVVVLLLPAMLHAQTIGSVATADAEIVNASAAPLALAGTRATLTSPVSLTARDHTAEVKLARGGTLHLCQSTPVQITETAAEALLFSLDRGSLELHTKATPADSLLTPDLRLTPLTAGALDLAIRVARNGDTCVDNRGRHAPFVDVADAFGTATYQLKPGQHVLFEHGSLRAVVDRETTPCGCPPDLPVAIPLAEAALRGGAATTPEQSAAAHPFPVAVSDGLADPPARTPAPVGTTEVEVASTLTFDPTRPVSAATPQAAQTSVATAPLAAPPAPPAPKRNAFQSIGHFFKRLFVR